MKKYITLFLVFCIEVFSISHWFLCYKFADKFHFSAFDLKLRLEEASNNDSSVPFFIIRAIHNKLVGSVFDFTGHYLHFFDNGFLITLLSFAGFFGFLCGLYYGVRKYSGKEELVFFLLLSLFPTIIILKTPGWQFQVMISVLCIPLIATSLFGMYHFLSGKERRIRYGFILFLLILSIWWYTVFATQILQYCFAK